MNSYFEVTLRDKAGKSINFCVYEVAEECTSIEEVANHIRSNLSSIEKTLGSDLLTMSEVIAKRN